MSVLNTMKAANKFVLQATTTGLIVAGSVAAGHAAVDYAVTQERADRMADQLLVVMPTQDLGAVGNILKPIIKIGDDMYLAEGKVVSSDARTTILFGGPHPMLHQNNELGIPSSGKLIAELHRGKKIVTGQEQGLDYFRARYAQLVNFFGDGINAVAGYPHIEVEYGNQANRLMVQSTDAMVTAAAAPSGKLTAAMQEMARPAAKNGKTPMPALVTMDSITPEVVQNLFGFAANEPKTAAAKPVKEIKVDAVEETIIVKPASFAAPKLERAQPKAGKYADLKAPLPKEKPPAPTVTAKADPLGDFIKAKGIGGKVQNQKMTGPKDPQTPRVKYKFHGKTFG